MGKVSGASKTQNMVCRSGCGACCIAPSITTPMPGMPEGKPAGQRCLHLDQNQQCLLWERPERPEFCSQFAAEIVFCGTNRIEAITLLTALENQL